MEGCKLMTADERVEVTTSSCPYDGKLSLNADETQVGQQHEDVERKREYYHIIFPERTLQQDPLPQVRTC